MTFSTVKENQAINKFLLMRVNPARFINDDMIGVGPYTYAAPKLLNKITENGVELTKVVGTPSAGEWSQNDSTLAVDINPNP